MSSPAEAFGSLPQARAYVDTVREQAGSLGAHELIDALDRMDQAYREFPELALERPPTGLSFLMTLLLDQVIRASRPISELSSLLGRFPELRWEAIEPAVAALRGEGRRDAVLEIISAILDRMSFRDKESAAGFANLLTKLLADAHPLEIAGGELAELVRKARSRLKRSPARRHRPESRAALLALTERLRVTSPPAPAKPLSGHAWPSGRLSFDEFLLQWPCEIELPADLDDAMLIDVAYQAILLRGPDIAEREQYLRLLRDGAVSREWIIEDLLASAELHSLDRRLRVVYGGRVITDPADPSPADMPAVTWPPRSAG